MSSSIPWTMALCAVPVLFASSAGQTARAQCGQFEEATPRTSQTLHELSIDGGAYQIVDWGGTALHTIRWWGQTVDGLARDASVTVRLYDYPFTELTPDPLYSPGGTLAATLGTELYATTTIVSFPAGASSRQCVDPGGWTSYDVSMGDTPPSHPSCPSPMDFWDGGPCCFVSFPNFDCYEDYDLPQTRTEVVFDVNLSLPAGPVVLYLDPGAAILPEGDANLYAGGRLFDGDGNKYGAGQYDLAFSFRGLGASTANTPCGTDVCQSQSLSNGTTVEICFDTVTGEGDTSMVVPASCNQFADFSLGYNATALWCYDLSTTAAWSGNATICIDYPTFLGESLRERYTSIQHYDSGAWSTVGRYNATLAAGAGGRICGTTTSLSPFVLGIVNADLCIDAEDSGLGALDCQAETNVFYAVVTDTASGEPIGTGRCTETAGIVDCDRDDNDASQMKIYPALMCALP